MKTRQWKPSETQKREFAERMKNDMDYKAIILKGYFHENDKSYLKDYFYREYKKAEQQHYKADEFFSGLLKVVEGWINELEKKVSQRKIEIAEMIGYIKQNEPLSDQDKQDIKDLKEGLDKIHTTGINNPYFNIYLKDLPNGKSYYNLVNTDISIILKGISKALESVQIENLHL